MNYQLVFHTDVEAEVEESYFWYEGQQEGLGERFLAELVSCYHNLQINPAVYGRALKNYRRLIVRHFPFVIAFEIVHNAVFIYAVFHTSRNPNEILKRIP